MKIENFNQKMNRQATEQDKIFKIYQYMKKLLVFITSKEPQTFNNSIKAT